MYEIIDEFRWDKNQKIITNDKHHIPGLKNISHFNFTSSFDPSPLHYHSNIIEIHCMIKSKRLCQIEKDGILTDYVTKGNQLFISYPYEVHGNGMDPLTPFEFYAFQIDVSNPYDLLGLNEEYSFNLYRQLMNLNQHQLVVNASHIGYLRSAFNFISELDPNHTKIGVQFLCCFLFNLSFLQPLHHTQITQINPRIKLSIDYLTEHLCEELQLNDLATVSGYSLSRFKTVFKQEIGITPADYINLQKMEYAKERLRNTNHSITDLSYALGFSTPSYFCSVFKKYAACTPAEYRKYHAIPI